MASASAGDPQSLNLFAYTRNNPVDFIDPSGLYVNASSCVLVCAQSFDEDGNPTGSKDCEYRCEEAKIVESEETGPVTGGDPFPPGGGNGPPPAAKRPCEKMAQVAVDIARRLLNSMEDSSRFARVLAFDKEFSQYYVGRSLATIYDAWHLWRHGPVDRTVKNDPNRAKMLGQADFRVKFREGKNNSNDQTHHFVTYLSAGINGFSDAALLHRFFDDNKADKDLGVAALRIGMMLRNNAGSLSLIGEYIREKICATVESD